MTMNFRIVTVTLLLTIAAACAYDDSNARIGTDVDIEPTAVQAEEKAAYFVFNYRINDRQAYDPYLAQVPNTLEVHGAQIVAADFDSDVIEGNAGEVTVVLKFASEEAAMSWYQSPQYQAIIGLRTDNSVGIAIVASAADD